MFNRRETHHTLGEPGILGDEAAAALLKTVEQLQAAVTELKDRVDSQFTTISAHAEIARQQTELARGEARADLDRTRDTLIDLVEQVRLERSAAPASWSPPGAPTGDATERTERIERLEHQLAALSSTVDRCFERQNELADTMAAFLDTVMAETRGEPVFGLSLT